MLLSSHKSKHWIQIRGQRAESCDWFACFTWKQPPVSDGHNHKLLPGQCSQHNHTGGCGGKLPKLIFRDSDTCSHSPPCTTCPRRSVQDTLHVWKGLSTHQLRSSNKSVTDIFSLVCSLFFSRILSSPVFTFYCTGKYVILLTDIIWKGFSRFSMFLKDFR